MTHQQETAPAVRCPECEGRGTVAGVLNDGERPCPSCSRTEVDLDDEGISLREVFAGLAMAGLLAGGPGMPPKEAAGLAVAAADALLEKLTGTRLVRAELE